MATIARNRIEKVLPRVLGGKRYTLENCFRGEAVSADWICAFIRDWTARRSGKLTIEGGKGCYALHSNHWVEFEVEPPAMTVIGSLEGITGKPE
jgi:hypothetical protein